MARPAIDIIIEAKRKIEKNRKRYNTITVPFEDAATAAVLCDPSAYQGNNKSEYIKKLSIAAALLVCEIETIQSIKGDGIEK